MNPSTMARSRHRSVLLATLAILVVAAVVATRPAGAATLDLNIQDKEAFGGGASGLSATNTQTAKDLGARGIRVFAEWRYTAPNPTSCTPPASADDPNAYNFPKLEKQVENAVAKGLNVTVTFDGPIPCWGSLQRNSSNPPTCTDYGQPGCNMEPDPAQFRKFVKAVVTRVGYGVDVWSGWNEPNRPDHLTGQGASTLQLALTARKLWKTAYDQIHNVQGHPGAFYFGDVAWRKAEDPAFARQMLCLTQLSYPGDRYPSCSQDPYVPATKALSFHSYLNKYTDDTKFGPQENQEAVDTAAAMVDEAMGGGKLPANTQLAEDEAGVHVCKTGTEGGIDCDPGGVPEDTQQDWLNCIQRTAWTEPKMIVFNQYQLQDPNPDGNGADGSFYTGLRRLAPTGQVGADRPALNAFAHPIVVLRDSQGRLDAWGGWPASPRPTNLRLEGRDANGNVIYSRFPALGANGYFRQTYGDAPTGLTWYLVGTLGSTTKTSRPAHNYDCDGIH